MVIWFVRALFILLVFSLLLLGGREGGPFDFQIIDGYKVIIGCIVVIITGLSIDFFVPRKKINHLAGMFFGLIVGLLIGLAFNRVIEFLYETYNINPFADPALYSAKPGIMWMVNLLCCYLAIVFIMQTKDDFRFIIPYVEFSKQTKGTCPFILDTSVIIDGRIADIVNTGIINSPLVVPRFILDELQNIADSHDRLRRTKGRRGLDMLNKMQSNKRIDLTIDDISLSGKEQAESVDLKLVSSAILLEGSIITNDYNLNKVAQLRGVDVININDLSNAVKPVLLPGETIRTKIMKPGDQHGQGVGYMDDGTMIVAEHAKTFIGREVNVLVTSILQTSAGRMIFGKIENHAAANEVHNSPKTLRSVNDQSE